MKTELSNQIIERLTSFGLSSTGKENIDQGERIVKKTNKTLRGYIINS